MTRNQMIKVARQEIAAWNSARNPLPRGLVLAVLFAFIHRLKTGETVEETFFTSSSPAPDYEI